MAAVLRDFDLSHLEEHLIATDQSIFPHAASVEQGVLIYHAETLLQDREIEGELYSALSSGPGIVVVKGMMQDHAVLDQATAVFENIIQNEKKAGKGGGDHFAKPGANDRIWNSFEKHCFLNPENFAAYYANPVLEVICRSWLGPAFQMTAQVNRVNPGGAAQTAHRDYHLGFMTEEQIRQYPPSVHQLSPMLTLQGAIAHVDMPIEAGPTMYLPHSQKWLEGYVYAARSEVQELFAQRVVQLPLAKGDAVFFNPAVLHGAGENRSKTIYRMSNLLQVSSAMGRAMERVDREAMVGILAPIWKGNTLSKDQKLLLMRMVAEGYPFPTSLDENPPKAGLAPHSGALKAIESYGLN